jgi:CheY-like chemotaxis protein
MARNGEEALQGLRNNIFAKPDLIFLDLNMPRVNGKQCLKELKKDNSLRHIPVIIYTTSKLDDDKSEMQKLGAAYSITKPRSFSGLYNLISEIFSKEMIDWN